MPTLYVCCVLDPAKEEGARRSGRKKRQSLNTRRRGSLGWATEPFILLSSISLSQGYVESVARGYQDVRQTTLGAHEFGKTVIIPDQ